MSDKASTTSKSKSQRQRFIEAAKELEADETGKAFEDAFGKIVPPKHKPHESGDH